MLLVGLCTADSLVLAFVHQTSVFPDGHVQTALSSFLYEVFWCSSHLPAGTCAEDYMCCFAAPTAEYRTLPGTAGFTKPVAVAGTVTISVTIAFISALTSVSIAS